MKDKSAYQKMIRGRTVLLLTSPFYGCLAMYLKLEEVDERYGGTMAVDGYHLYYYPPFVHSLKEDEIIGVLAHEVSHCAYKHMTRRGHRLPLIWNIAGDYVINADLLEAKFVLPKDRLFDAKYKGMPTEEVYELVLKEAKQQQQKQGKGQSGDGDGAGKNSGQSMDPGKCGGVIDAGKPGDKAGQDQIATTWEANVRHAINVAKNANAGKLPGHLQNLVGELQAPRISWRDKTRNFIDNSMTKDFSWSRPNRRNSTTGLILPGYMSDRLSHLVMVMDTSGSIDQAMGNEMVSEGAGALDEGTADRLTIIYADTDVQYVDEFSQGDVVTPRPFSGGGTDFRKSFEYIKENCPDASCIIYLTDMCTCDFGEEPSIPVLWAAYLMSPAYQQWADKAPFGEIIQVAITVR